VLERSQDICSMHRWNKAKLIMLYYLGKLLPSFLSCSASLHNLFCYFSSAVKFQSVHRICAVIDAQVNARGFICTCVAMFCTSLQQIVSCFPLSPVFLLAFLQCVFHYDIENSNFDRRNAILQSNEILLCDYVFQLSTLFKLIWTITMSILKFIRGYSVYWMPSLSTPPLVEL
jgi:hypothetical protein